MKKILVANRGEIARRVMRTCRQMGLDTVAVFSDPDATAPFVREADEAVRLPGATSRETYLDIDRILDAVAVTGADAIHPGYGFLAEDASFARACEEAGVTFIGPPATVIDSMGSKLEAKARMADAGLPVLTGLEVSELSSEELEAAADRIGWPLLIKAEFGGGGRGMRAVQNRQELLDAVDSAMREAEGAFGSPSIFLEHYVERPRHIEVQIVGDLEGRVADLFERECSIQRRYQKVIEEAPSPAVDEALRRELGAAAVAAGEAVGYVGAGTVEFIMAPSGEFWFLEMNTRLQVEHPVTECIAGLDLVRLQLEVASGLPLPDPVLRPHIQGHAIEARLYAEDVGAGFAPVGGHIVRFRCPEGPGIRIDVGVESGSDVPIHYDSLLAKVVSHASSRKEATERLARTLKRTQIHGVVTNRDLLVSVLQHPDFLRGRIDTHFLRRHDPATLVRRDPAVDRLHAVAASQAARAQRVASWALPSGLPSGWRNNPSQPQEVSYETDAGCLTVRYATNGEGFWAEVDGEEQKVELVECTPERVQLEVAGVRRSVEVHRAEGVVYVESTLGSSTFREVPRFRPPQQGSDTGSLVSSTPGIVVRVEVGVGQSVESDDTLVVIEAMKTEHRVVAGRPGVVRDILVDVGQQVAAGQTLVILEEDEHA